MSSGGKKRKLDREEEEYLPRGGTTEQADGEVSAPKTKRSKLTEPSLGSENLFQLQPDLAKKKHKRGKNKNADIDVDMQGEDEQDVAEFDTSNAKVEILNSKSIREGVLVLAAIREISEMELLVSLPNNLKGVIKLPDVSDTMMALVQQEVAKQESGKGDDEESSLPSLAEMYYIGQFVRCVVVRTEEDSLGRHKVFLSMRESLLNRSTTFGALKSGMTIMGSIQSIEDHGYIVSVGFKTGKGFLALEKAQNTRPEGLDQQKQLLVGQSLEMVVTGVNNDSNTVFLDAQSVSLAKNKTKASDVVNMKSVQPGMRVGGSVSKVLANGLWIKFLGYFAGSVDIFHLDTIVDYDNLRKTYKKGQKVEARVIYIDLESKKVSLTLQGHVVNYGLPVFGEAGVEAGQIFEEATVVRIDKGIGLALQLPTEPVTHAYVHTTRISDRAVAKVDKTFPIGTTVRCRVLGFSYLDDAATATMKESEINEKHLRYEDLSVGEVLQSTITAVHPTGLQLKFNKTLRGFCPKSHFSDVEVTDPEKHGLKVNATIAVRILSIDPKLRRVVCTHKKTLIKSELPLITSYNVEADTISHGVISGITPLGCKVMFFNNVRATVGAHDLGGVPLESVHKAYKLGQVHKFRVVSANPFAEKLKVSFSLTPSMTPEQKDSYQKSLAKFTPGSFVSGKVKQTSTQGVWISVTDLIVGFVAEAHMSDHIPLCAEIRDGYKVGQEVKDLLVLRVNVSKKELVLTAKPSLCIAAKSKHFPSEFSQLQKGELYPGYINSIKPYGVFVSFGGMLNGLAPKALLADAFVADTEAFFTKGQTVFARVEEVVEGEKTLVSLALKPSLAAPVHSQYLPSLFSEMQRVVKKKKEIDWGKLQVGSIVSGKVAKTESYGAVIDLGQGVNGFAHTKQTQGVETAVGKTVTGVVLDVDFKRNIVDLSLRPELVSTAEQDKATKSKKSILGYAVDQDLKGSIIELVKLDYLVVSVPKNKGQVFQLAYVPTRDYNDAVYSKPFEKFQVLQKIDIRVAQLPDASNANRLIAAPIGADKPTTRQPKTKGEFNTIQDIQVGAEISCTVESIKAMYLLVKIGAHVKGRLHMTEIFDEATQENPLQQFRVGQEIPRARVYRISEMESKDMPITQSGRVTKKHIVEVTIKPSVFAKPAPYVGERKEWSNVKKGTTVTGWVHQVTVNDLWIQLSSSVRGRVYILDASNDIHVLQHIREHFKPGQGVKCVVLGANPDKHELDLSIKAVNKTSSVAVKPEEVKPGMILPGRIARVLVNVGVNIQLFGHTYGRVFITDLSDSYSQKDLEGYVDRVGEFVQCYVLATDAQKGHFELSLRPSRLNPKGAGGDKVKSPEFRVVTDIVPGMNIQGFIKSHEPEKKLLIVSLGRHITAKVNFSRLRSLEESKIPTVYPIGKLVTGRILKVDAEKKRVAMSLRPVDAKKTILFADFKLGQKVRGNIKRVETFGIFIRIQNSKCDGLCHIAEVLDEGQPTAAQLKEMFSVGDIIKAVVIRKNEEKKTISLSIKPTKLEEAEEEEEDEVVNEESDAMEVSSSNKTDVDEDEDDEMDAGSDEEDDDDGSGLRILKDDDEESSDDAFIRSVALHASGSDEEGQNDAEDDEEMEVEESPAQKGKDTKAVAAAAPVVVGGIASSGVISAPTRGEKKSASALLFSTKTDAEVAEEKALADLESLDSDEEADKPKGKDKKKPKKGPSIADDDVLQRELDLDERERAIAGGAAPQSPDDFERLLLASPNNSMLWIQYMAYWIFHNEIAKARELVERALKRIDIRQSKEKANVWVAFMNMENKFGTYESLMATFKRACAFNDAKPIHIELLKILVRSDKIKQADEVFGAFVKKWKTSKSVWIRYGIFKYRQGDIEGARALLDRSLKSLAKRKHLAVISKFAQLEYQWGSAERGRTIFENVLTSYPKRVDIWSIYIDMELKTNEVERIRSIFERVITLSLSSKKMKFFFKRYLAFEKEKGTAATANAVKDKAKRWVEMKTSV